MSPILKRDLCFIAKYAAIGLTLSVGIAFSVFSEKNIPYHATAIPLAADSAVWNDHGMPMISAAPNIQVVGYTPH